MPVGTGLLLAHYPKFIDTSTPQATKELSSRTLSSRNLSTSKRSFISLMTGWGISCCYAILDYAAFPLVICWQIENGSLGR